MINEEMKIIYKIKTEDKQQGKIKILMILLGIIKTNVK